MSLHGRGKGGSGNGAGRPPGSGSVELKVPEGIPPQVAQALVQQTMMAVQRVLPLLEVKAVFDAAQSALLTEPHVQHVWAAHAAGAKSWGLVISRPSKVQSIMGGGDDAIEHTGYDALTRIDESTSMEDALKHVSLIAILTSMTARALFFAYGYKIQFRLPRPDAEPSDQPPPEAG